MKEIMCNNKELIDIVKQYNLILDWNGAEAYKIVDGNDIIAVIEYDFISDINAYYIYNFEVINKGCGIGTKYIDFLKKKGKFELNYKDEKSKSFWLKNGFKVIDEYNGTMEFKL